MIQKQEVMDLFLSASPSYKERWLEYVRDSYDDGEERLLYVDNGDFTSHIVDLYQKKMLNEFPCIFKVVENLHTNGDSYVREAATIGFLESLQNHSLHVELDPEVFVCYYIQSHYDGGMHWIVFGLEKPLMLVWKTDFQVTHCVKIANKFEQKGDWMALTHEFFLIRKEHMNQYSPPYEAMVKIHDDVINYIYDS